MNTTVINLGKVRDMLVEWEKVRQQIVSGKISGFQTVFVDEKQRETIYLGGVYKNDPRAAMAAALKLSAARMLNEDAPIPVKRAR
jgi:hypothetical protein